MNREKRSDFRQEVVGEIRRQLVGPAGEPDETLTEPPFWRYLSGILFPNNLGAGALDVSEEPDVEGTSDETFRGDPSLSTAYDALPASMGVSFYLVGAKSIACLVEAGRYEQPKEREKQGEHWHRVTLGSSTSPARATFTVPPKGASDASVKPILDGRAEMHVVFRPRHSGHLVTVTMINAKQAGQGSALRQVEDMLFQCRFRVSAEGGRMGEYPTVQRHSLHEEDAELALSYRNRKTFGIGHGCACTWELAKKHVTELMAEPLPTREVRGLTNHIGMSESASRALSLRWLASNDTPFDEILDALRSFAKEYKDWIDRQNADANRFKGDDHTVAVRMVGRQRRALERMHKGIELLAADRGEGLVGRAFGLAQRAMLEQFLWSSRVRDRIFNKGHGLVAPIDPWDASVQSPRWRPFQLAFQLIALESVVDPTSKDRKALDLLWFPTGGGKTEAYLALSAFDIALRRLKHGDAGAGTSVLMRYTLRLLTSQQFERCATLVSVLEHLRRTEPGLGLGDVPISLGLWVGGTTTPNQLDNDGPGTPGAKQVLEQLLLDQKPENPFQLAACPHCGTRIIPESKGERAEYGVDIVGGTFQMRCPDDRCPMSKGIPVTVVDEDIYERAPTIVIGTIDKFARMVWEPRSRTLLGCSQVKAPGGKTSVFPPSLVIQDELHLITGPLGTIAGAYEAALDSVMKVNGVDPKYLAATATIQRAEEQCMSLYAREAFVFPPPGLDASNNFFSREDTEEPGRMFVGAMNNGLFGSLSMLVQASAAAAHAVQGLHVGATVDGDLQKAVDSYWTQVIYHNSRQELGKTTTLLRDDVATRLKGLEPIEDRRRRFENVEELSANLKSGAEVTGALKRLRTEWPDDTAIDVLACTNMISVGVDVGRLGLMIVKGQPKTTAEYIQATSRVGRSSTRLPGIVLTLFTATRPRDRSHFESFQQYHEALYRAVEPVSVTPFAPPALDRTLHAALVLTVRHLLDLEKQKDAARFDKHSAKATEILSTLLNRLLEACPAEDRERVERRYSNLVDTWSEEAIASGGRLRFERIPQFPGLLTHFGSDFGYLHGLPWPTLNSMRHVDGEAPISNWSGA